MILKEEHIKKLIEEETQRVMFEGKHRFPHIVQYLGDMSGNASILKGKNTKYTLRFLQELIRVIDKW